MFSGLIFPEVRGTRYLSPTQITCKSTNIFLDLDVIVIMALAISKAVVLGLAEVQYYFVH